MRFALAALGLMALAACGRSEKADEGAAAPAQNAGSVLLSSTQNLPDWLLIAHQSGGGDIHFNQRTISRDGQGNADIWAQVRYGSNQIYSGSDGTTETIVRYNTERIHYRFRCADENFTIVERQIMGSGETVVARDQPTRTLSSNPSERRRPHRFADRLQRPLIKARYLAGLAALIEQIGQQDAGAGPPQCTIDGSLQKPC